MAEGADDDTERSEEPTQKKLDDALKRGDVAKSQEVTTWFVMSAGALGLAVFAPMSGSGLVQPLKAFLERGYAMPVDGASLQGLFLSATLVAAGSIALPVLLLAAASILGNMLQHPIVFSTEGITPKFSKISPMAGLKRLFSKESLMNFVKGLIKLGIIGVVLVTVLWPKRDRFALLIGSDPAVLLPTILELSLKIFGSTVAVLAVLAAFDWFYQRMRWYERQKMSLQEIKEEFKQLEGNPEIKARIRQLRMERSKRRMMAAVPTATVVVTNPTHYAVALKWEKGMAAPLCVAKGTDQIALKIREVATGSKVPIVENPPLARALHATVEVDQEIPVEHYKAVAEVIGYVLKLRKRRR